jgi:hypothetical protein
MHYFASSTLAYLRHNYSGFYLRDCGTILALAALLLLLTRPRNAKLLRWEVWCMAITSLVLFAIAHAVLFRLYLPHRYTYPLLPFFCIVIGVLVRPNLDALAARSRRALLIAPAVVLAVAFVALWYFPLGPELPLSRLGPRLSDAAPYLAVGAVVGLGAAALVFHTRGKEGRSTAAITATALVASSLLIAEVAAAGGLKSGGVTCRPAALYDYLGSLPKDTIIAGDPLNVNCVPIAARRPVVISQKLYQPWNTRYLPIIRQRMFDVVRAYYGPSTAALVDLRTRYGADYLLVRTRKRTRAWRWPPMAPFTGELRRILRAGKPQAALQLPKNCETWRGARFAVYSLACVAERSQ